MDFHSSTENNLCDSSMKSLFCCVAFCAVLMSTLTGSVPGAGTVGCLVGNVQPAAFMGSFFTALHVLQGAPFSPQLAATNIGFLYAYGALQCPMEAFTRRRSWTHNFIAGGALGYVGIERRLVGLPFNLDFFFLTRRVPLPVGGALVYGSGAAALAIIAGKPL